MFSVGILYAAQDFLSFVDRTPGIDLTFPSLFGAFSAASPQAVLTVSQDCDWVGLNTLGQLDVTERGRRILQAGAAEAALQVQLEDLVETYRPKWLPLLSRGRAEALKYLPIDVVQCLREAALTVGTSDKVVGWWDRCSRVSRREGKDANLDVGRKGEKLSLRHEMIRTKRKPIWQSIESNLAGFDILSVVSQDDLRTLRIEVKTSNTNLDSARFFVTQTEWAVASTSDQYLFHLWCLQPKPRLLLASVEQISDHVPYNKGKGQWEKVMIPFSAIVC
jgi:hypothetical protein